MPWTTSRPPHRYGRDHATTRAAHLAALRQAGSGTCAETRNPGSRCLMRTPVIYPTDDLHLCHNSRTRDVIGLGHARCNIAEAARRANALSKRKRQTGRQSPLRW